MAGHVGRLGLNIVQIRGVLDILQGSCIVRGDRGVFYQLFNMVQCGACAQAAAGSVVFSLVCSDGPFRLKVSQC